MTLDSEPERDDSDFVTFGSYPPPKAKRFLDALIKAQVRFEIECEDGASYTIGRMGHFGMDSQIHIFVDPADLEKANRVQNEIFGDVNP